MALDHNSQTTDKLEFPTSSVASGAREALLNESSDLLMSGIRSATTGSGNNGDAVRTPGQGIEGSPTAPSPSEGIEMAAARVGAPPPRRIPPPSPLPPYTINGDGTITFGTVRSRPAGG